MAARQAKISKEYVTLQQRFPLRPLRNAVQHKDAVRVLGELARKDVLMDQEKRDYFEVLSSLVESYERTILKPRAQVLPQEILKLLMQEHGLRQTDLIPFVKYKSHLSAFFSGKRNLSKVAAASLGAKFKVDPMLFLPRVEPIL